MDDSFDSQYYECFLAASMTNLFHPPTSTHKPSQPDTQNSFMGECNVKHVIRRSTRTPASPAPPHFCPEEAHGHKSGVGEAYSVMLALAR